MIKKFALILAVCSFSASVSANDGLLDFDFEQLIKQFFEVDLDITDEIGGTGGGPDSAQKVKKTGNLSREIGGTGG